MDLVPIHHDQLSEIAAQDQLFQAAVRLGLSPETVNSAARFFVNRIPDWKSHLVLLISGPVGLVFRPDLTLFIVLKLSRATAIDLEDISSAVHALGQSEFDFKSFQKMADSSIQKKFLANRNTWGL
jgi:hypothetical protein